MSAVANGRTSPVAAVSARLAGKAPDTASHARFCRRVRTGADQVGRGKEVGDPQQVPRDGSPESHRAPGVSHDPDPHEALARGLPLAEALEEDEVADTTNTKHLSGMKEKYGNDKKEEQLEISMKHFASSLSKIAKKYNPSLSTINNIS